MEDDALRELQSKVLFLSPENFRLNFSLTERTVAILTGDDWFTDRYLEISARFAKIYPLYKKFYNDFVGNVMSEAANCAGWLCLFDLLPERARCDQLNEIRAEKYDRLALLFYDIREGMSDRITRQTEPVLKQWCAIIAASVLTVMETELNHESIQKNPVLFAKLETFSVKLILGFCSDAIEEFHQVVRSIAPNSVLASFPESVAGPCAAVRRGSDDGTSRDRMLALTLSKMNSRARRKATRQLFEYQQQTPLVTRAMELHGVMKMPPYKKAYAKTDVIRDDTERWVKACSSSANCRDLATEYVQKRKETMKDLCRTQSEWTVRIHKTLKGGNDLANSPIGSVMFYQKLERDMRKKQNETQADRFGRVQQEEVQVKMDLSQLDEDIAWAIAEDKLMS